MGVEATPASDGVAGATARERTLAGLPFFCSWSGGKDAYLALQRAAGAGGRPRALLTMLEEGGSRSRGHGLPLETLRAQAAALGLPLVTRVTTWDGYEEAFIDALHELCAGGRVGAEVGAEVGARVGGVIIIRDGVFGDIDLEPHRDWVERVCGTVGLSAHLPLWKASRRELLDELLAHDVRATIVAVKSDRLNASFLGRVLDDALISDLEAAGVDACGEEGEYHTMVTDGPLFAQAVPLVSLGVVERDGCHLLDIAAARAETPVTALAPVHAEISIE